MNSIQRGDKVWSWLDGKTYRVVGTTTQRIGDRDVAKIKVRRFFKTIELFYDNVSPRRRASDGVFGWIFGR